MIFGMWVHDHKVDIIDLSQDKNVMVRTRKYYLKKPLFDLEVKGQGPRKVIMIHDTLVCHIP
jgi:hypothetical protein